MNHRLAFMNHGFHISQNNNYEVKGFLLFCDWKPFFHTRKMSQICGAFHENKKRNVGRECGLKQKDR